MKMNKRANQILELLTEENKIEVSLLSEKLGVSQVTVRKDLDELENQGIIVREHGFACLRSTDNLYGRIAYHYEAKQKIAKCAANLISDGDTLMIESGSCCALLAEELTSSKKDLTIITNSAFIADYIRGKSNFQIVLLGGIYQQDSQVLVGPMIRQCVENFYVKYFFHWHGRLFQTNRLYKPGPDESASCKRYGMSGRAYCNPHGKREICSAWNCSIKLA